MNIINQDEMKSVFLLVIRGRENWLSEQERVDFSRHLGKIFGAEQFVQGRESAETNDIKWAIEELPLITAEQSRAVIGDESAAGMPGFVGKHQHMIQGKDAQVLRINVRSAAWTDTMPIGDFGLMSMLHAWSQAMLEGSEVFYGADHPSTGIFKMTAEDEARIRRMFVMSGKETHIVQNGEIAYTSEHAALAAQRETVVVCNCCGDAMDWLPPLIYKDAITGEVKAQNFERHNCSSCGERMTLSYLNGVPMGFWLGTGKGARRVAGPVTFAKNPGPEEVVDPIPEQEWPIERVWTYLQERRAAMDRARDLEQAQKEMQQAAE